MMSETEANLNESLLSEERSSRTTGSVSSGSSVVAENLMVPKMLIPRGQFASVIGKVGSGKTTFLYSILGEIDKREGTLSRRGTIAYIPQVSWLRSATIRENIVF